MLEELQMSPPAAIGAFSAGARICGGSIVCGGALPLVAALLVRFERFASDPTAAYLVLVAVAACALAYLGNLRAAITHNSRKRLSLQTLVLAVPVVVLARVAGGLLLSHMQQPRA